ncbi:hypothetical protein DFH09DRAFT_1111799 [Mycena vulgaris]|nr:hypothetical protein DFH09DRAFT_1111799 [Mycena vulgaris]
MSTNSTNSRGDAPSFVFQANTDMWANFPSAVPDSNFEASAEDLESLWELRRAISRAPSEALRLSGNADYNILLAHDRALMRELAHLQRLYATLVHTVESAFNGTTPGFYVAQTRFPNFPGPAWIGHPYNQAPILTPTVRRGPGSTQAPAVAQALPRPTSQSTQSIQSTPWPTQPQLVLPQYVPPQPSQQLPQPQAPYLPNLQPVAPQVVLPPIALPQLTQSQRVQSQLAPQLSGSSQAQSTHRPVQPLRRLERRLQPGLEAHAQDTIPPEGENAMRAKPGISLHLPTTGGIGGEGLCCRPYLRLKAFYLEIGVL